jgi:hypothetical protein
MAFNGCGESRQLIDSHMEWNCSGITQTNRGLAGPGRVKYTELLYKNKSFYLETPVMECPLGARIPPTVVDKNDKCRWLVDLSFDDSKECQIFMGKCREFDQFMIDEGTRKEVENKYCPMIRHRKSDGTPYIRLNISFSVGINDNEWNFQSGSNLTDLIPAGCRCRATLAGRIWSQGQHYGVTWTVRKIVV